MYYVYWIHNEYHTDIQNQGYIGITNNIERRKKQHLNSKQNTFVKYNLNKNGKIKILLTGSKDYCLIIENILRPDDGIGWNLTKGGGNPPVRKVPHTKETKQKISLSNRKKKKTKGSKESYILRGKKISNSRKGQRTVFGEKHHSCKLNESQVVEIFNILKNYKRGMLTKLAKIYNVDLSLIAAIRDKKIWKHILI